MPNTFYGVNMHTTRTENASFYHNGDFDGDVIIRLNHGDNDEVRLKFADLKQFMAAAVRSRRIERIENMCDDGVLGI